MRKLNIDYKGVDMKKQLISCFILFSFLTIGIANAENPIINTKEDGLFATLQTVKGDIVLNLEFQKVPMTVCSFVGLAEGTIDNIHAGPGEPYFDGVTFHRYVANFVIQGGDPTGTGSGSPGYSFPDEFDPTLRHDGPGILSMANAGPNTNGSQFFITHSAQPHLDDLHSVFGNVVDDSLSMVTVNAIREDDTIRHVIIERVGTEAQAFKTDQAAFDSLVDIATGVSDGVQKEKHSSVIWKINQGKVSCLCMVPRAIIDLAVYTLNGREIYSIYRKRVSSRTFTIPYRFKPGVYLLNMKIGKSNTAQKFLVP